MASLTVVIFSAASSGISSPNSSSKAMTSSTMSRLSAPRSSMKLASSVTLLSSTPRCSTTIFLTRSAVSLMLHLSLEAFFVRPALAAVRARRQGARHCRDPRPDQAGTPYMFGHKRAMHGPSFLRDAAWLSGDRARAVRNVLLVLLPVTALAWLLLSHGEIDPTGKALGTDYLSFWTAARLALAGHPAAPYDAAAHYAAQRAALGGTDVGYAAFFYPPAFLLVLLPFGLLPYLASLAAWLATTLYAYWRAVRLWLRDEAGARLSFLAYPALILNAGHGQN